MFIFPRGRTYSAPSDEIAKKVVDLLTTPGESRDRLSQLAYTTLDANNPLGLLQEALELAVEYEPIEKRLRQANKEGLLASEYLGDQITEAEKAQVISKAEARNMRAYHEKVLALMAVDDFAPEELSRGSSATEPAAEKKAPAKKSATRKKATDKASPAGGKKTRTKPD